jgi:glyoxylase-like metal-dependent hydrolase (beta-lactamase superfamily II)
MRVGDFDLIPLNDGLCRMSPQFYVGLDFSAHPEMLGGNGTVDIPIGCFLMRSGDQTILIDAGLGAIDVDWARGGELPGALREAGVAPGDVDVVVCTHLHVDHIGWLVVEDGPFFPNATVRYGAADWQQFVTTADEPSRSRHIMEVLAEAGRLDPLDGDMVPIARGVTARHTPGHTPGHYGMVISSGKARAVILGDAVECPLQLEEPDFYVLSDVDPALAARTRETLWRELEGTSAVIAGAHFPGLEFGRVLAGTGKRTFTPLR